VRLSRDVERCPPVAVAVLRELEIPALTVHAVHNLADAAPRVEPVVDELQLGRMGANERAMSLREPASADRSAVIVAVSPHGN